MVEVGLLGLDAIHVIMIVDMIAVTTEEATTAMMTESTTDHTGDSPSFLAFVF